jgi:hypothetical protein
MTLITNREEEVYKFIETDLLAAIAALPENQVTQSLIWVELRAALLTLYY